MSFNPDKSHTLTLSLQNDHLANPPINFLHNPLEEVESLKCLGLTMSYNLSWANHRVVLHTSPESRLSLLPTGGRAQPVVVLVSPKTLAFLINLTFFAFHFTKICGLCSNLSSVKHHLVVSTSLNILLLSETQLSSYVLVNYSLHIPNCNLYSSFHFK